MRDVTEENRPITDLSIGELNALANHNMIELSMLVTQSRNPEPPNERKEHLDKIIAVAVKARMYNNLVHERQLKSIKGRPGE